MISIRRIQTGEWQLYRDLRLASLKESPAAFSSTYAAALERSAESWRFQADDSAAGDDRATFFAFVDKTPAGIAALYRDQLTPRQGEVLQVWVASHQRGTGLAQALIQALLAWGAPRGFQSVRAGITPANARALRFYRKLGFRLAPPHPGAPPEGVTLAIDLTPSQE